MFLEATQNKRVIEYFQNFNFFDIDCLRQTISKVINLGIIAGAFIFKIPQVLNIIVAQDVKGLSGASLYMDAASFLPITVFNMRPQVTSLSKSQIFE